MTENPFDAINREAAQTAGKPRQRPLDGTDGDYAKANKDGPGPSARSCGRSGWSSATEPWGPPCGEIAALLDQPGCWRCQRRLCKATMPSGATQTTPPHDPASAWPRVRATEPGSALLS